MTTNEINKQMVVREYLSVLDQIFGLEKRMEGYRQDLADLDTQLDSLRKKLAMGVGKNIGRKAYVFENQVVIVEWQGDDAPARVDVVKVER